MGGEIEREGERGREGEEGDERERERGGGEKVGRRGNNHQFSDYTVPDIVHLHDLL